MLSTRANDRAADGEYELMRKYGGLKKNQLQRLRLESERLPRDLRLADYSGVIVGGSPFNASDDFADKSELQQRVEADMASLLDKIVDRDFPFLGACYGVGTLGLHQGAVIDTQFGEEVGPVLVELTDAGRTDLLLANLPDKFYAYVGHKEAVSKLPPGAVLLATSSAAPVQMFRLRDNLYATQFHPELDLAGTYERIDIYRDHGYFKPAEEAEVVKRVRSVPVTEPFKIIRNFVQRYAVE